MTRREFGTVLGMAAVARAAEAPAPADYTLRIGPAAVDLGKGRVFRTTGYNGSAPGPLLRMPEGKLVTVEVFNDTDVPEVVHWHGLHIPSGVDGAMEEGTPMVAPHGSRRYSFPATPAGTRWYHTHTMAGRNLKRGTYTGQFGFLSIDPKSQPGAYDQEIFVALREWDAYITTGGDDAGSMDVAYKHFAMHAYGADGRAMERGEPLRVKAGERVLLRVLNASATKTRQIALAGHTFQVMAMDGNRLGGARSTTMLQLGPAERIDALVEMANPGVWTMGTLNDADREAGMRITVEYAGATGNARWSPPLSPGGAHWDYTAFGHDGSWPPEWSTGPRVEPEVHIPLLFEKKWAGNNWVDRWTINGKSYPQTDPIRVGANTVYRLVFDNRSDEAHPVHLHRHRFELTRVEGKPTTGVWKDTVVVRPRTTVEVDFSTNNPGPTLFHCHQQMHMDHGFMALMEYR